MPQSRVAETSNTTGTVSFNLTGAPVGLRTFASAYVPAGGVPIYYAAEGVDASGNQTGQWEVGRGFLTGSTTLTRDVVYVSSAGVATLCPFSAPTLRILDAVTPEAVSEQIAAAITTHAALTSGVHGISVFGSSLAGAANSAAATALLNTFTSSLKGLVPTPGSVGSVRFLREDGGWIVPINSVDVTVDFGATFTDKAVTVVTGLTWVTPTTKFSTPCLRAVDDPDEIRLLDLKAVISDIVNGVGFTLTVFSEPEAKGSYTFSITGV